MRARLKGNWEAWALAGLLLVHMVLGVYWSMVIPIWEAHDEDGHWFFVRLVATEHRLPKAGERSSSRNDEMHQPPLYYILAALPVSLVDLDDGVTPEYNPYVAAPDGQGGRNQFVHDARVESWPYRGTVLAVHLARWVSVLLGALTLLFTYLTARELCPGEPSVRWGAVLLVAFWPQFRFSTAVINNDIMLAAATGAVTWLLVRLVMAPQQRLATVVALAAATSIAVTAKLNGLVLLPGVLLALLLCALSGRRARKVMALVLGSGSCLALLTAGWLWAGGAAPGLPLLLGKSSAVWVSRYSWILQWGRSANWGELPRAIIPAVLRTGLRTFWAGFGWNNIWLPESLYQAAAAWGALGLLGLAVWLARRPGRRQTAAGAILGLLIVVVCGSGLLYYVCVNDVNVQGRYFVGVLPVTGMLLSVGWNALLPRRARATCWAAVGGALLSLAVLTPAAYISPHYSPPPELAAGEAAQYVPVHATFGGFVELVGYRIDEPFVDPTDTLRVSLAWRVLARAESNYALAVQVFGPEHRLLGEAHHYPGHGRLATMTWEPGYLFAEDVAIQVASDEEAAYLAKIEVSFFDPDGARPVQVRDANGNDRGCSLVLDQVKVRGVSRPAADSEMPGIEFGDAIRLTAGRVSSRSEGADGILDLHLDWYAAEAPQKSYTASLQLRDADNGMISQIDSQPRADTYPTSFWEPGEVIEDTYALRLPAGLPEGTYIVCACLYDLSTLQRLRVRDPDRAGQLYDEMPLCSVLVGEGWLQLRAEHRLIEVGEQEGASAEGGPF